jgi:2-succinyl-5-enolpyruvyl-6-hydroxy-3-cyclohexene-1-carboxylate synthase
MSDRETLTTYAGAFVDELTRSGVREAVVSPGSRSTPMALLLADHPEMNVWMNIDERSAGFFALGIAKAKRESVALLCTSGTAAANYFPAIIESYQARVPLVVLTADRPHELRDIGAPQSIDQIKMYGDYVKLFKEMALPENTPEVLRYIRAAAGRAAGTAISNPAGPVHLNFPFREPLTPFLTGEPVVAEGRADKRSYVAVNRGTASCHDRVIEKLVDELSGIERGLIVCGSQEDPALREAVVRLAGTLHYPVLADPLSQLRSGSHDKKWVIDGYDAFLRNEETARQYAPEVVVRLGAMPVSKAFLLYMKKHSACRHIVVDTVERWREPTQLASDVIEADPVEFCGALIRQLRNKTISTDSGWANDWFQLNRLTQETVKKAGRFDELFEGGVFTELQANLPEYATLFVGNSMPVRDLDTFFCNNDTGIRTMANRGANGIDGVVSSALGASTDEHPLVLVIGDLSFFHDLNGLLAAKMHRLNVTIVVVNNDGGGIFSFLPQAKDPTHFEELFGTPVDLDFQKAVHMYGGTFSSVEDWTDFRDDIKRSLQTGGLNVIEVKTNREANAEMHHSIWQAVSQALKNAL